MEQQYPTTTLVRVTKRTPELATDTTLPTEWVDGTSNLSELHFQDPPGTQSKKLAVALGVGISSFILLIALIYLLIRRRRQLQKKKNSNPAAQPIRSSHSSKDKAKRTNTGTTTFSSKTHWKSKRTSTPPTRPSNPTPTQLPPVTEITTGSSFPIISIPPRAETRTPIAELSTTRSISELESTSTGTSSTEFSTAFNSRRQSLPPLPRLHIQHSHSRTISAPFNRLYPSPGQEISALTPNAAASLAARHGGVSGSGSGSGSDSEGTGNTSTFAFGKSPQLTFSPVSPLESATSSTGARAGTFTGSSNHESMRRGNTVNPSIASCFPYGYQSEYPEVIEGMAGETQSPSSPLDRQRAMMVLQEEERIVKQRMNAVRELVRLKNEEARILEAKRQLGIAVR
ncbi:Protein of unknown function [Pyronema omphalodes CBS 100304]|uniref:Uncharacterized protein n=1 Tax=Pyronema omphalodes (strain CBS 100304) TaxID=1076935 RepID=U4LLW7_PYROM|nr:Protein of unknown function [Pyronema omphalodes CBS 100304]